MENAGKTLIFQSRIAAEGILTKYFKSLEGNSARERVELFPRDPDRLRRGTNRDHRFRLPTIRGRR